MTNKIIALLTAVVIALAVLAYKLSTASHDEVVEDTATFEAEKMPDTLRPDAQPDQHDDVQPTITTPEVTHISSETTDDVSNDSEVKLPDEKLCQLIHEYDDWYPKGEGYESETFMSEIRAWAFSRGYFETEYSQGNLGIKKQSDYDFYEIDDLETMAQAGDSMANVRLAYRLYLKGDEDNMERAQPYCDRAIADGYTALVMCKTSYLTTQIHRERRKEGEEANPELVKALELEYLAWQQASKLLGDDLGSRLTEGMLPEQENEFEKHAIEQKTKSLISDIDAQRLRLGIVEREHPPIPKLLTYVLEEETNPEDVFKSCFDKEQG